MRSDLFKDRKGIHIALKKDTHAGFRMRLFEAGLSMQAAIEEFANLVAKGDVRAKKILDDLAMKRIKEELGKNTLRAKQPVDELDHETLYHLIEEDDEEQKEKG